MGRAPCCDKANVKRGPWSPEEDATLKSFLETHGTGGNWIALPKKAGLRRCGKSCRLRWLNYLRPDIKHGGFTEEEDNIICTLYAQMGSRWSAIASQLSGRTDNDVKNYWNTKLKKKIMAGKVSLKKMTFNDPSLPSTPLQLTQSANKTQSSDFPASQNQNYSSPSVPPSVPPFLGSSHHDASSGLNIISAEENISFDQIHQSPKVLDVVSKFGASSGNINNNNNNTSPIVVSLSQQEGSSSISDSSSIAMSNKCAPLPQNVGDESMDMLMDFGFGYPYDLVNGLNCHDTRFGDQFAPSCYPEWVDFSCSDNIKPH